MQKITLKQIAEYCRDYIDLVSPSVMSRGGKRLCLPDDVFNAEPLLKSVQDINYDEQIVLPINLCTDIADLGIENEDANNESEKTIERDLIIARELDDIYRKFETNNYTKQLSLQFGHISFKGVPNFEDDNEELEDGGRKYKEGYLFSVSIIIKYKDSAGQRKYEIIIDDSLIKTNIGFVKNYMKLEYRDELYKFIAIEANDDNSSIPISEIYIDELWAKITTYLKFSDAIDISENPDMCDVVIALEPKANYFLSQDLTGIIQAADDDALGDTSLSAWVDKEEKYPTDNIEDNGENELFFPFAYDKYQLQVLSKIKNKGLIVEGPPGTGKSQTISNILVHLAATGKKVLFVSQKDQAVRGVKDKLKSLDIPCLFGYMPDRSSRLHTDEDEKDSASYALRGISQSYLDEVSEKDPKIILKTLACKMPLFNSSLNTSRIYVEKYNQWISLDAFDFGVNSTVINEEWYQNITKLRENIEAEKRKIALLRKNISEVEQQLELKNSSIEAIKTEKHKISESFKEAHSYPWLQNEQEYVRDIGYEALFGLTCNTIVSFEASVIDRKLNIVSAKLNEFKLSKELSKTLKQLPFELYETYRNIVFSNNTKTERRIALEEVRDYLSLKAKLQKDWSKTLDSIRQIEKDCETLRSSLGSSESRYGDLNSQLNSKLLDSDSMLRFEELFSKYDKEVFDKIQCRLKLDSELKCLKSQNPNLIHEEIMHEKQEYNSQVKNYIRNRIAARAQNYRSLKQYRSALESIAWKLSKTKKAYKTFDRLKSDPFNFDAMSAVTPIWMMGLDDASRILPLLPNLFDYVIIDEASQCNISYTLPVMYRAKHAIFFGDTLQMRDTTISFKSNNQLTALASKHSMPENLQIKAEGDSVKSVMDIAKLNGFETVVLKKHYRSPKELIGFSNDYFYAPKNQRLEVVNDDILATEDGHVLKTHLIQADPNAEISSKSNLSEAYYIKQLIGKIKSDEGTRDKSIAVLSFFNEQAELLRRIITDEDVKISSIEGIQGDERDIIIYSFVITSPSDKRRYTALTGESGEILKEINEGRVNVAFSRARLQVHAVTSLAPNLWPDGIWIKKYFEYIEEHGRVKRLSKSEQSFDSHFEEEVYDFLMQKLDLNEYRIYTQVESCGFRIDQVITNIKTKKKLAIECDGPSHFDDGNGQIRVESDFERQYVLEAAHWTFYRISYIDWQQSLELAKRELIAAIENHFTSSNKLKEDKKPAHQDVKYEPIKIEIPEAIFNEHKERVSNKSSNNYFGHKSKSQEKATEKTTDNQPMFDIESMENSKVERIMQIDKPETKELKMNKESAFNKIGEIRLGKSRSIVISCIGNDGYWFNEKVDGPNFNGLTQKGFGLKSQDWDEFKSVLNEIASNSLAKERRFRLNNSTELVIYHPSSDTVDMRQYITSSKYTGWTKKGIRVTNENAKIIVQNLKSLNIIIA